MLEAAIADHRNYVSNETLAIELRIGSLLDGPSEPQPLTVNDLQATVALRKANQRVAGGAHQSDSASTGSDKNGRAPDRSAGNI